MAMAYVTNEDQPVVEMLRVPIPQRLQVSPYSADGLPLMADGWLCALLPWCQLPTSRCRNSRSCNTRACWLSLTHYAIGYDCGAV